MSNNKLQNTEAIKKLLDGTHQSQTSTTTGIHTTKNEIHLIGDTWEEKDPTTGITYIFEQKDGFVEKQVKDLKELDILRKDKITFKKCPKETCTCTSPNRLDFKMKSFHEMCYDCVIEMETELKRIGKFDEYEFEILQKNVKAWLEQAERDVEMVKRSYTTSYETIQGRDGQIAKFAPKMTPEQFNEKVEKEFEIFKQTYLDKIEERRLELELN